MEEVELLRGYDYPEIDSLGKWYIIDGYCLCRIVKDGDPLKVKDRVAFMEKSMRVRVKSYNFSIESSPEGGAYSTKADAWLSSGRGSVYDAEFNDVDEESFEWANKMLELLY